MSHRKKRNFDIAGKKFPSISIYESILIKIYMNAKIMNTFFNIYVYLCRYIFCLKSNLIKTLCEC